MMLASETDVHWARSIPQQFWGGGVTVQTLVNIMWMPCGCDVNAWSHGPINKNFIHKIYRAPRRAATGAREQFS
jgi:hypothetical protein